MTKIKFFLLGSVLLMSACNHNSAPNLNSTLPTATATPTTTRTPTPSPTPTPTPTPTPGAKSVSITGANSFFEGVCTPLNITFANLPAPITADVRIYVSGGPMNVFSDAACLISPANRDIHVTNAGNGNQLFYVKGRSPITRQYSIEPRVLFSDKSIDGSFAPAALPATVNRRALSEWKYRNFVDVNGDGKTDIFKIYANANRRVSIDGHVSDGQRLNWMQLGQNLTWAYDNLNTEQQILVGDFGGDGKTEFATVYRNQSGNANFTVYGADSAGNWQYNSWAQDSGGKFNQMRWMAMDLNRDGRTDIVACFPDNGLMSCDAHLSTLLASGTNSFVSARWLTRVTPFSATDPMLMGDFNGDQRMDFARVVSETFPTPVPHTEAKFFVYLSMGDRFSVDQWGTRQGWTDENQRWVAGDFNGDGRTDLGKYFPENGQFSFDAHLSDSAQFRLVRFETMAGAYGANQRWVLGDFNGDDKMDIANVFSHNGLACVDVHESNGNGFTFRRYTTDNGGIWPTMRITVGDFDGDGKSDLGKMFESAVGDNLEWNFDGLFSRVDAANVPFLSPLRMATAQGWSVLDRLYMRWFGEGVQDPASNNPGQENDPNGQIMLSTP